MAKKIEPILIQEGDIVRELKGDELEVFENDRQKLRELNAELVKKDNELKQLKISAYKKLGLTDEEIATII